jgi:hypothetical protein
MTTCRFVRSAVALFSLGSVAASALPLTYVASYGNDANSCSRAMPCRSFAGALVNTDPGGLITALDTGGYGSVTINKSVTVVAPPGVYAGVTAGGGTPAITVAAAASDFVTLRGLYLNNQGGTQGVLFTSGLQLLIESVTLTGFTTCIRHVATGRLVAVDVEASGCNYGLSVANGTIGALARATVERFRAIGMNIGGVLAQHGSAVAVRNSVLAFARTPDASVGVGAIVWTQQADGARLDVLDTLAFRNEIGLYVIADGGGSPNLLVNDSVANDNTTNGVQRLQISGTAAVRTTQSSMADGNSNTGTFTVEPLR